MTDIRTLAGLMAAVENARADLSVVWTPELDQWADAVRSAERAFAVLALFPARQPETDRLQIAFVHAKEAGEFR